MYLSKFSLTCVAKGVAVNLNSNTKQTLYTVPTGLTFVPVMVVLRDFSATAATGVVTLGRDANASDFAQSSTLTNANGSTKQVIIQPVPAAVPIAAVQAVAAENFGIKPTTIVAATCSADVFGYLY